MATRFSEFDNQNGSPLDSFTKVEQQISSLFDTFIRIVTARRDQLLAQLNDMKLDFLNKEERRKKHLQDFENIIQETNLEKDLTQTINDLKKYRQPTASPVPVFRTENLRSLLQQLERIGTVMDVRSLYSDRHNPVRSIGKGGIKKGELNEPLGICLEGEKRMYFCDSWNSRIQVFSKDGTFRKEFGKGQLVFPHSIELYDKCALVSDWGTHAVFKFHLFRFVCRSVVGELYSPRVLTVNENKEVLVADCNNNRIAVLNSDLIFVREIGKGKLKCPCAVKIHLNEIFVVDESKPRNVHVFSKSADFLYSFISLKGTGYIFMCFDHFNNIIISDSEDKSIQIYTLEGHLLHCIECEGNPTGVAVTNDNIIVCAMRNLHSIKLY